MSLINKRSVRKAILDVANSKYAHVLPDSSIDRTGREWNYTRANQARASKQFSQVTQQLLTDIDVHIRVYIETHLDNNPQTGKTVK